MKSEKQRAKDRAWEWFSKYIRARDCLRTTGTVTQGRCCTCGAYKAFEDLQAGHAIPGRGNAILFNEMLVHAQCERCNRHLGGNYIAYNDFMVRRYGQETVNQLWQDARKEVQFKTFELRFIAKQYREEYNKLVKGESR